MKKITLALLSFVLLSSLTLAVTRTGFLNNQRTQYANEIADLQAAKDALLNNSERIDRINTGLPLLEVLIAESQDAELRADWLEMYEQFTAEVESWDRDLASWDERIAKAQDKVDEIDRLLGL